MSAFVVGEEDIDLMVYALTTALEDDSKEKRNVLGQMLRDENFRSVNFRYGTEDKAPQYVYERPSRIYNQYEIYKVCRCYFYQTCETDDYQETEAIKAVEGLCEIIEAVLGKTKKEIEATAEYEEASWGL